MPDLSTTYLGLTLRTPIVPSASPLSHEVETIKKMEEMGAGAVVLHSLFEEQLDAERQQIESALHATDEHDAEATSYFPRLTEYNYGPDEYLEHIRKVRQAVKIPVIASLNGSTEGGWVEYARKIEQAGASALELNIYSVPTDPRLPGADVERTTVAIVRAVRANVKIPLAVKLSPFYSNVASVAQQVVDSGAQGLVLFNRFYQPDLDLENLTAVPTVTLSSPSDMRLPLRWVALLFGKLKTDFAGTSGVYAPEDAVKMTMAGANVTMMCSALLKNGVGHIRTMVNGLSNWMEEHEYESVKQMRGALSQKHVDDKSAFERAQYMKALVGYRKQ